MSNDFKQIAVETQLHQEAKARAAREGLSLKELTERALRDYLWTNRLTDTRAPYDAQEESPCTP